MAAKGSATAEVPSETAESPPEEKTAIQVAEEARAAAEERARTAESTLVRLEDRLSAVEGRLQEAPTPAPVVGEVPVLVPKEQRRRAFACPQKPDSEWLIKVGQVRFIKDPNSPTGQRDSLREGDVKIRFQGGLWYSADPAVADKQTLIDDKERIAWCEKHPEEARDVEEPMTPIWFEIKKGQMATSRSDPAFSQNIDVDAALAGDMSKLGGVGGDTVLGARELVRGA
jgi:hypothetical protein